MIERIWGGKVPVDRAGAFHAHLLRTGVADYRAQTGCVAVRLYRKTLDGWAHFLLCSTWKDMDAIRNYAGSTPEAAVLYPDDDAFGLVPDRHVAHYEVLALDGGAA